MVADQGGVDPDLAAKKILDPEGTEYFSFDIKVI